MPIPELVGFGLLVAVAAVGGLLVGRLVAPALTCWADRQDEDDAPRDDTVDH